VSTNIASRIGRCVAAPVVLAGIIGGAALGLAGMANAGTYPSHDPTPRPGIVATPQTKAQPPATAIPGKRWHRDHIVINLAPDFTG
jgi:hypothetical protein